MIGLSGLMVDIDGLGGHVSVGDRLILSARDGHDIPAEIVGFRNGHAQSMPLAALDGLGPGSVALCRGAPNGHSGAGAGFTFGGGATLAVADGWLVLQLRILAAAVVRVGGTSLMLPSPSRPSENEAKPGDWMEEQTCEQSADLRNAEYAGCDQAQAARATGLLSFALLAATCRS